MYRGRRRARRSAGKRTARKSWRFLLYARTVQQARPRVKAEPLSCRQSVQWQMPTRSGGPLTVILTCPQRHDPVRSVTSVAFPCGAPLRRASEASGWVPSDTLPGCGSETSSPPVRAACSGFWCPTPGFLLLFMAASIQDRSGWWSSKPTSQSFWRFLPGGFRCAVGSPEPVTTAGFALVTPSADRSACEGANWLAASRWVSRPALQPFSGGVRAPEASLRPTPSGRRYRLRKRSA